MAGGRETTSNARDSALMRQAAGEGRAAAVAPDDLIARRMRRRGAQSRWWWLVPTIYIVVLLLPLYWLINMSFKTNHEILTSLTLYPHEPTLANYRIIF